MSSRNWKARIKPPALAVFLLSAPGADPLRGAEIRLERIFGPETPTGKYKHPACVEELRGGDLYLVFHGGAGEYAEGTAVYGSRRERGREDWSPPRAIASNPFHSLGNAVVWQAPEGTVWLFFVTRHGDTWSTSRISAKVSRDGARTWSDSSALTFEAGTMVRGRPIVLDDGDYLLPVYHETGSDPELVPPDSTSFFLRYDVKRKRWLETGRIRSRIGNIQPAVVQIAGGRLIAYCRRGGDYQPRPDGWLVRAESGDGGRTWSEGKESGFPNPNAAVDFIKLRNGHLALFYNDSMNERTPLAVAISADQGTTFPCRRNVVEGPGDFAYPSAIQTADGRLLVVFTSEERTVINLAVFEESAVCGEK
jgi:predicted neuraminidase